MVYLNKPLLIKAPVGNSRDLFILFTSELFWQFADFFLFFNLNQPNRCEFVYKPKESDKWSLFKR